MSNVVVGVGNPVMSDDGVGKAVVEAIHDSGVADGDEVRAIHAGTTAFLALEAMSGAEKAIVVDAVEVDYPPGTIHTFALEDGAFGDSPDVLMHDFSFTEALRVGADTYDLPDEVVLIGVVPADLDPGLQLSETVRESVPSVLTVVKTELAKRNENNVHTESTTMESTWYCKECDERIDDDEVEAHEEKGHTVQGKLRPERLLEQDPWQGEGEPPEQ